jgi:hypothetical protein
MNEQIWTLIAQLGTVALVPLAGFLSTLLIQQIKLSTMQIKGTTLDSLKLITAVSVQGAQQKFKAGMIKDKKAAAMETAKKLCEKQKIKITDDLLSELIESGVWDELNSPSATTPIITIPITSVSKLTPEEILSDATPLG